MNRQGIDVYGDVQGQVHLVEVRAALDAGHWRRGFRGESFRFRGDSVLGELKAEEEAEEEEEEVDKGNEVAATSGRRRSSMLFFSFQIDPFLPLLLFSLVTAYLCQTSFRPDPAPLPRRCRRR